ncbi:hypothetical protein BDF20DRAFT_1003079 [Mycotypha africana]|uniref:uncharacterized protein n=1 Tax=Mycotypha africana TaxID=64632 RepID=UPI002300CDB9|nr:uncharacterized protein BDF20DRAFT_1003079 [Mycotypha africana]KAI8971876.1 hypothetical protein BDF20DRAFT_1003079 [Mycotypha africana]
MFFAALTSRFQIIDQVSQTRILWPGTVLNASTVLERQLLHVRETTIDTTFKALQMNGGFVELAVTKYN